MVPFLRIGKQKIKKITTFPRIIVAGLEKKNGRDIQYSFLLVDSLQYPDHEGSLIFPKLYS